MDNTENIIKSHYEAYEEDARLCSQHGMVEFITTMSYIEKYLNKGDRVLEIGAGTGRYSHTIAQKGYSVDAIELVEHNIEIFKRNTVAGEDITVRQGNAVDLSTIEDNSYDMTLLLGPMYHLFTEEEQKKALSEALRVTKHGGKVFVSYCGNDATAVQFLFGKHMTKTEPYNKLVDLETFKLSSTPQEIFVLHRKEDIDALMTGFHTKRLHFVGTDMATQYMRDVVDEMDEEEYALYLKYVLATCEREDLVGASNHLLDVFEKI
ncbi:MAG: class I SAM-dependent methyltransferase [Clostridia bacterium]|nr:class I SAM-dependent methyltransferase [Clostridia bacterium]